MWDRLFSPEVLFLLGILQALSPYALWYLQGKNTHYSYEITYIPAHIMIVGYLCFWLGAKSIRNKKRLDARPLVNITLGSVKIITKIFLLIVGLQILAAIRVYGGLPLLGYLTASTDVWQINRMQANAAFGQLGLLTLSLFFLNGLAMTLILKAREKGRRIGGLLPLVFLVVVIGETMAGKTQGLLIAVVYLLCGLSICFNNPVRTLLRVMGLPRILTRPIYLVLPFAVLFATGFLGSARTGNLQGNFFQYGLERVITYMQVPLINTESASAAIGYGPYQYDVLGIFVGWLPYRLMATTGDLTYRRYLREPTAGFGFFGPLQWNSGLIGVVLFSFFIGRLCRSFYNKSSHSLFHLLVYCQIAWTLIAANSYNHFLTLVFLPLPAAAFFLFSAFIKAIHKKSVASGHYAVDQTVDQTQSSIRF